MTCARDCDLVALVADTNIKHSLLGIFSRHRSIGCAPFSHEIIAHPHRDPGCLNQPMTILRPYLATHSHALVVFDREGCGREEDSRIDLESLVEDELHANGWNPKMSTAIAIDPELENWVWSTSPHVSDALGWSRATSVRSWLEQKGLWDAADEKPARPKEALELVLRETQLPRSSSRYKQLAEKVSFARCADPAFLKLLETLRSWFPVADPTR